jgi:signal transduction histidine kinase
MEESDGTFRLRVEDNGIGFDPARVKQGNGLKTMRRRAEEMGGRLEVGPPDQRNTSMMLAIDF